MNDLRCSRQEQTTIELALSSSQRTDWSTTCYSTPAMSCYWTNVCKLSGVPEASRQASAGCRVAHSSPSLPCKTRLRNSRALQKMFRFLHDIDRVSATDVLSCILRFQRRTNGLRDRNLKAQRAYCFLMMTSTVEPLTRSSRQRNCSRLFRTSALCRDRFCSHGNNKWAFSHDFRPVLLFRERMAP